MQSTSTRKVDLNGEVHMKMTGFSPHTSALSPKKKIAATAAGKWACSDTISIAGRSTDNVALTS